MELSLDLLNVMTTEDVLKEALRNQHRYSAEPTFYKSGHGKLLPTSIKDYAIGAKHTKVFVQKLKQRSLKSGKISITRKVVLKKPLTSSGTLT